MQGFLPEVALRNSRRTPYGLDAPRYHPGSVLNQSLRRGDFRCKWAVVPPRGPEVQFRLEIPLSIVFHQACRAASPVDGDRRVARTQMLQRAVITAWEIKGVAPAMNVNSTLDLGRKGEPDRGDALDVA